MKLRVLVANLDGRVDRNGNAFLLGSVQPATVPVTRDFDPRLPPVGTATLVVEGTNLYADLELQPDVDPRGLVPALGGTAVNSQYDTPMDPNDTAIRRGISEFDVREVSLCTSNSDERIPPIH